MRGHNNLVSCNKVHEVNPSDSLGIRVHCTARVICLNDVNHFNELVVTWCRVSFFWTFHRTFGWQNLKRAASCVYPKSNTQGARISIYFAQVAQSRVDFKSAYLVINCPGSVVTTKRDILLPPKYHRHWMYRIGSNSSYWVSNCSHMCVHSLSQSTRSYALTSRMVWSAKDEENNTSHPAILHLPYNLKSRLLKLIPVVERHHPRPRGERPILHYILLRDLDTRLSTSWLRSVFVVGWRWVTLWYIY